LKFIYESNRIYIKEKDSVIAEVKYRRINDVTFDIYSTYVDPKYRGRHLGKELLEKAYNYLKSKEYNVEATCSYANKWLQTTNKKKEIWNEKGIK